MKSTHVLLIIATGACLLGTAVVAADTTTPTTPPVRRHKGPPPSPEMEAYHQLVLSIYDTDKSGTLDETERSVLEDDIAAGTMQPPPVPPVGRGPRRGPPPEILALYDADKDGTLNDTERAALEADIASGKLPPPPHGRGPSPAPGDDVSATTSPKSQS